MQDLATRLSALSRPRLLVRAAHNGQEHYRRDRDLRKLLNMSTAPRPAVAIVHLLELERMLNDSRLISEIGYSFSRHIEVLIALQCEAQLLRNAKLSLAVEQTAQKNGPPHRETVVSDSVKFAMQSYEKASGMEAFFSAT